MDLQANIRFWDGTYDWQDGGEEWSAEWGNSRAQWFGSILPRIARFLPAAQALEIAPGFGRWTRYLMGHCEVLEGVDISRRCVEHCTERFGGAVRCHLNDGMSLAMIPDRSIDFIFSFDSLVHAEADVLDAYVREAARVLTPSGAGFIHHSSFGDCRAGTANPSSRAPSMTRQRFADRCEAAGIHCIAQERVNWCQDELIDCFSTFAGASSPWRRPLVVLENPAFMTEATLLRQGASLYHPT